MKSYVNTGTLIGAALTIVGLVAYKKLISPTVVKTLAGGKA